MDKERFCKVKEIVLAITLLFSISTINAEVINKKCVSQKTGKSTYNINLDTLSLRGVLDYEFMGQKITYEVTKGRYKEGTFTGVATFLSSQTGETHDEPFIITYKTKSNIFSETNGTYKCN
jgi:hypothetical protein